jgi:hypothetical protein
MKTENKKNYIPQVPMIKKTRFYWMSCGYYGVLLQGRKAMN